MDFTTAVEAHLATVERRDIAGFAATVHPDVTVVLPAGRILTGRDQVTEYHRGWFADPDWRMDTTEERIHVAGGTGLALYTVDYHDIDADGAPTELRYRLSLVFTRGERGWLLLHDQNTFC